MCCCYITLNYVRLTLNYVIILTVVHVSHTNTAAGSEAVFLVLIITECGHYELNVVHLKQVLVFMRAYLTCKQNSLSNSSLGVWCLKFLNLGEKKYGSQNRHTDVDF